MSQPPYLFRLGDRLARGLTDWDAERRDRQRQFLLRWQTPDGGFSGRDLPDETAPESSAERDSDLYYTAFAIRGLAALGAFTAEDGRRIAPYLRQTAQRQASVIDVTSWLYGALMVQTASGIDVLEHAPADWPDQLAKVLESFRTADGGYAKTHEGASGSTYHTFLVALCYELIGRQAPEPARIVEFVHQRQRDDGGFVEIAPMRRSGTNPTAAAVALLTMFDAVNDEIREDVADFLMEVRSSEGGFQANTRVPFADSLSTFTGYLTCLDLGLTDILDPARIRKFVAELEMPGGGYRAAAWDQVADVEYTFYALGLQALIAAQAPG